MQQSEPVVFAEVVLPIAEVVARIAAAHPAIPMSTKILAIDGCGGSGKSTLAARLSNVLGNAPVIHTDDFASWDNPQDWWPRLLEQVLGPLAAERSPRYQRYDWEQRRLVEWIEIPRAHPLIVLEGVTAMRTEFEPYLAFRIWVEASAATRLLRGLERDGAHMRQQWLDWMDAEDGYVVRDAPVERANLVVAGEPITPHNPDLEVIALRISGGTPDQE